MLIRLLYILDRLRHVRTRADDLARLLRQLITRSGKRPVTAAERDVAAELRRLRVEVSAAFGRCQSCTTCAVGHPPPHGHHDGGHCCGGGTENVYTLDEIATLRLAGTRPRQLVPPKGPHVGCIFRSPTGCSLPPEHRPNICVSHICRTLGRELAARGDLDEMEALCDRMHALFRRFMADRGRRLAEEALKDY